MRLRKVKGAAETIAAHPNIVVQNEKELKGNWQSVFEKEQPLYIEVGMGKGVYLNFSDPWPKPRHAKRRLTHENFLKLYQTIMKEDGAIRFKTDNRLLFEYSLASLSQYGMILQDVALDLHKREDLEWNVMTEYEQKFSAKGQPIYRLEAVFAQEK